MNSLRGNRHNSCCSQFIHGQWWGRGFAGALAVSFAASFAHAQQENFEGSVDNLFNNASNWDTYSGPNFVGNPIINISGVNGGNTTLEVAENNTGMGGLTNSSALDLIFNPGSPASIDSAFGFSTGATINPGANSFTFQIKVTGTSMGFDLSSGGTLSFEYDPDDAVGAVFNGTTVISNTTGSIVQADTGSVEFNGMVNSDADGHFTAMNGGSFTFNAGMTGTGLQTFELINDSTINFAGGDSTFDAVDFTNSANDASSFTITTGSITFNGAVTSSDGGNFIATANGDYLFNDSFSSSGSQTFEITNGGSFNFKGATSFDGGVSAIVTLIGEDNHGTEGATEFYFNEVTNVDGVTLRAETGAQWFFRQAYNYSGDQSFTGDGTGSFYFEDYDSGVVMELGPTAEFTANNTALIFERTVHVSADTTVHAVSGGSYEFQRAMESGINATYSAAGGSKFTFADFTGEGSQNFIGDDREEYVFADVSFDLAGSGLETATFNGAAATMTSLELEDGYNVSLGGFDGATLETEDLTATGSHTFHFETSAINSDSVFTVTEAATFGDDVTLTFDNSSGNGGNGHFNASGDVELGTGTTTFNLSPSSISSDSLRVTLGSATGSIETSGNIDFNSSSTSENEHATAELAGAVELEGDLEEVIINSTMGLGGVLELSNGALGSVDAQVNVISGKLLANGINSVGEDLTVDLAADTIFELKPTDGGDIGFVIGELTGGGTVGNQAIIQSVAVTEDVSPMLQVLSGNYSGIIQDSQESGDDSTMSLSVQEGEFTFSGNGTYSGTTGVADGGKLILTGEIDSTTQVQIRDNSALEINNFGKLRTKHQGSEQGNFTMLSAESLVNLNDDAYLYIEGSLTVGGQFTASDRAETDIDEEGVINSGGILTIENHATMNFMHADDSLRINSGGELYMTDHASITAADTLAVGSGGTLTLVGDSASGYPMVTAEKLKVESGGSLIGNGNFDFGASGSLSYAGSVRAGASGEAIGRMEIKHGNLIAKSGGTVTFGLSYDSITQLGNNSFISVNNGYADFRDSDTLWLEVQKNPNNPLVNCYIPTDQKFTLLKAQSFQLPTGTSELRPVSYQDGKVVQSVTRRWITQTTPGKDGLKHLNTQSEANYLGWKGATEEFCLTGELTQIGDWLNSVIPTANADPDGELGQYLGYLDTIIDCNAYEQAVIGTQPTALVSAIHMAPQTQFFDVLRNEIRREAQSSGVGSPVPLRLSADPETLVMQADEQEMASTVQRTRQPKFNYAVIGRAFYRHLSTPNVGNVLGFDGDEYGGFGGFAFDLSKGMIIGFDIGYSEFSGNLNDGFGTEKIGTLRAGPYFSYADPSGWFIDLALSGGWNHYSYTRVNGIIGGASTEGTGDGFEIDAMVGGGFRFDLNDGFAITPKASFLYSYVNTGTVTETPNSMPSLPMDVDPGDLNSFIGRAGVNLAFKALPGLIFDIEGGWQGNYTLSSEYEATVAGGFALPTVSVDSTNLNTAYYGGGVSWLASWSVGLNLRYAGRSGGGLQSNMLYGGVSFRF